LKEKDKISDDYRKQVDELIDNPSNLNLFKPLNEGELDKLWEEISAEMDIGEVWNNISSDLDIVTPVDSGSSIIVKTISAVLIILTGMIPAKKVFLDSGIRQPDILTEIKQNEQPAEQLLKNRSGNIDIGEKIKKDVSSGLSKSYSKSDDGNKPDLAERNRTGNTYETAVIISNQTDFKDLPALYTNHTSIEQSIILPIVIPDDNLRRISVSVKTDNNKPGLRNNYSITGNSFPSATGSRISLGLITIFKNTWLLNYETFYGLKSESLNSSEIVFFPDMGISLNYSLNKRWQIQADGFFFSRAGQDYYGYYYGHYSKKEITLNYSTIALSAKYRFTGKSHSIPCSSINLLAGAYLSLLNQANQIINTDLQNIRSEYQKYDLGVRLGSEIEFHLFDNFSLAPGLFLSLGIPNIYKGNSYIPGNLRSTHNGSAEFHLAFYYHFE
jgi:hypothetical protein